LFRRFFGRIGHLPRHLLVATVNQAFGDDGLLPLIEKVR
jgi:hypothetical protein